jgi:hypothetical protein
MQRPVNLDELHWPAGFHQNRNRRVAKLSPPDGIRVGGNGRDRPRTADAGVAKAVHDVFGFDLRPHHLTNRR